MVEGDLVCVAIVRFARSPPSRWTTSVNTYRVWDSHGRTEPNSTCAPPSATCSWRWVRTWTSLPPSWPSCTDRAPTWPSFGDPPLPVLPQSQVEHRHPGHHPHGRRCVNTHTHRSRFRVIERLTQARLSRFHTDPALHGWFVVGRCVHRCGVLPAGVQPGEPATPSPEHTATADVGVSQPHPC